MGFFFVCFLCYCVRISGVISLLGLFFNNFVLSVDVFAVFMWDLEVVEFSPGTQGAWYKVIVIP